MLNDLKNRDAFLVYSNKSNLMTRTAWQFKNRLPIFQKSQTDGLKNSVELADRLVNLSRRVRL